MMRVAESMPGMRNLKFTLILDSYKIEHVCPLLQRTWYVAMPSTVNYPFGLNLVQIQPISPLQ